MQLNEMLNKKLKDDMVMVSDWNTGFDMGEDMVVLGFDNFDDLDVINDILNSSLIFKVEQIGIQLWVKWDNLFKQLYLEAK